MALAHILLENDSSTSLACQRVFRDRLNPIDQYNDELLRNILRFPLITPWIFITVIF